MESKTTMSLREELKMKKEEENRIKNEWICDEDGTLILRKDCTIEDAEQYVMENIFKMNAGFLERNSSIIAELFKSKDENHILANDDRLSKIGRFFAERYLENYEPILWEKDFKRYFSSTLFSSYLDENYFQKFEVHGDEWYDVAVFYTKKDNRAYGEKVVEKIKENTEEWQAVARKYFESLMKILGTAFKSIPYNEPSFAGKTNISGYEAAMKIHSTNEARRRLKLALENENLNQYFDAVHVLSDKKILLIKENMICTIGFSFSMIFDIAIFGLNGRFELEDKAGKSYAFEASIRPTYKPKSVIGHAMVGELLGGAVGGVIGAASAIEANQRNAELVANYDPLVINLTFEEMDLNLENETTLTYINNWSINKTLLPEGELEQIINSLKKARTHSACLRGELIKEFILDSPFGSVVNFEEEFETFEKRKMDELKCLLVEKYPELKEAYLKEEELRLELENVDKVQDEALIVCTEKFNKEISKIEDDIKSLETSLKQLGIFKGKEKRELNSQIEELKGEIQRNEEKYQSEKSALAREKDNMVRDITERSKEHIDIFSPAVLYEKAILEEQEREYEKHIFIRA